MKTEKTIAIAALLVIAAAGTPAQAPDIDDVFNPLAPVEFHITVPGANWWNQILGTQASGNDVQADLVFDGVTYTGIGIRIKGFTSAGVPGNKKPFNISMDAFNPGQDLEGYKTINLNNAYLDPSFTRETLSYEVCRRYMASPRTGYVKLYLNGTYWGLYVAVEQMNKGFLKRHYIDDEGSRYKGDAPNVMLESSVLTYMGPNASAYFNNYILKTPAVPNAWTDLIGLTNTLNNTAPAAFPAAIEQVLDVDRALWYLAVNNVIHNQDSYESGGHNYYMYFDPLDGRMDMLPWDYNMSFGVFDIFVASSPNIDPLFVPSSFQPRPLKTELMNVPHFKELYLAKVRTILEETYDWANVLGPLHNAFQAAIASDVQADTNKLYTFAAFNNAATQAIGGASFPMPGLQPFVNSRRSYLMSHSLIDVPTPTITNVTWSPQFPSPGDDVAVTAQVSSTLGLQAVDLMVGTPTSGAFAATTMFDDGLHGDGAAGDGVFGASFNATTPGTRYRFYVRAENVNGTLKLEPQRAEHVTYSVIALSAVPTGPVAVNEVLADNDSVDVDEVGEYEDWVELYNSGTTPFVLTDHFLTDDLNNPTKWPFPAGTTIPAGGHIRIWCDEEPADGPLHANFKVSKSGESIGLFGPLVNGLPLLDAVDFGQQGSDKSYARIKDGAGKWYFNWSPSGDDFVHGPAQNVAVRYDVRRTGSPIGFDLKFSGSTLPGQSMTFQLLGGIPGSVAGLVVGGDTAIQNVTGLGTLLMAWSGLPPVTVQLTGFGNGFLTFTTPPGLTGQTLYFQAWGGDLSNGLSLRFD